MDAGKQNLLNFLGQNQQLSIPIYQRKYSWTDKECKQLLEDVLRVGDAPDEENHFIGSIVYMNPKGHIAGPISKLLLIDGQQRITTISLLLSALYEYLIENPDDTIEDLMNYYLINDKEKGELRYKLILSDEDKDTLIKIINNLTLDEKIPFEKEDSIRVYENYEYFKKNINEENVKLIHQGLSKLLIIFVALEHNIDNPQLIFESLNSTGLELSQADLIRNYILMGLDPEEQENLYKTYWYKIEKLFENENASVFDKFIRDYLTVKTDNVPTFRNIYSDFKKYSRKFEDIETLVKDVFKFANYFKSIAFGKEEDFILKNSLDSLNSMGYDVTYPFLLSMYAEYDNGNLSSQDFIEIIKYTESYLFRRLICSIPTPSLNKTFAKMYNDLDKENFLESYKAMLLLKENYQRMPTNTEFRTNFLVKDIYNIRGSTKDYLFDKFENWESKEKTQIQYYTIEHIMPQNPNLSQEWIDALGPEYEEIQKKYLHTIGNLTLTGYNSEMSDKSFQEKRDMPGGFKQSAIRLNIPLQILDNWNEEEILNRSKNLIKQAYKIWPYPKLKKEVIEKYKPKIKKPKKEPPIKTTYSEYWSKLKEKLDDNPMFNKTYATTNYSYYEFPLADIKLKTGWIYFRRKKDSVECEIFINKNEELFNYLHEYKEELEQKANTSFIWTSGKDGKSRKIVATYEIDTNTNKTNWEKAMNWQIHIAELFYTIFTDKIKIFMELNDENN